MRAHPRAAIPLKLEGRVLGVISVWGLLGSKAALGPLDHELFNLLAGQAATALFSAKLYDDPGLPRPADHEVVAAGCAKRSGWATLRAP